MKHQIFAKITRRFVFAGLASVMALAFAQQASAQLMRYYDYGPHTKGPYPSYWACEKDRIAMGSPRTAPRYSTDRSCSQHGNGWYFRYWLNHGPIL